LRRGGGLRGGHDRFLVRPRPAEAKLIAGVVGRARPARLPFAR
jgi:hypothetical protein